MVAAQFRLPPRFSPTRFSPASLASLYPRGRERFLALVSPRFPAYRGDTYARADCPRNMHEEEREREKKKEHLHFIPRGFFFQRRIPLTLKGTSRGSSSSSSRISPSSRRKLRKAISKIHPLGDLNSLLLAAPFKSIQVLLRYRSLSSKRSRDTGKIRSLVYEFRRGILSRSGP